MIKRIIAAALIAATALCFAACGGKSSSENSVIEIVKPKTAATEDEGNITAKLDAVENSPNVNGKRFNINLRNFTFDYNKEKEALGESNKLVLANWNKKNDAKDNNGVDIQYWYYDDKEVSFTATVETESQKILNIGCGTTMNQFTAEKDNGVQNSDIILAKAALMAKVVCGFPEGSESILQDIFYRTATESDDSLWYRGYVFTLSTEENKDDSDNDIMQFRVFPITDDLKKEWKLEEY